MTDEDLARRIAANPLAAPDMAPQIDVRAIRHAAGMTQAEFAEAYDFSLRTVQEWELGARKPSGPARTLSRPRRPRSKRPVASEDAISGNNGSTDRRIGARRRGALRNMDIAPPDPSSRSSGD